MGTVSRSDHHTEAIRRPSNSPTPSGQRKTRVLLDIVAAVDAGWGGIEEHVCTLGPHLSSLGYEPLFLLRVAYPPALRERLAEAHLTCVGAPSIEAINGQRPPLAHWMPALRTLIRHEAIDIVHMHSSAHGNELWTALTARAAGVPAIVCTYHTLLGPESRRRRWAMRGMHDVLGVRGVAVSSPVQAMVADRYMLSKNSIRLVPNGIEDVRVVERSPIQPAGARVQIAVVSRLSPEKGVDVFLDGLAKLDGDVPAHATIIGDGDQLAVLRDQAAALGITDRVEFRGYVPHAGRLLKEFDLVVMPSRSEGFPLAAVEACAAGRPVIATRVGGLVDIVREGKNGWLVPPDDAGALARAMEAAIRDPELRARMGQAGREMFEARWRAEVMAQRIHETYQELLTRKARRSL